MRLSGGRMSIMATIAGFDKGGKYGMLRAIEQGYVQREIQNAAYEYQRAVDDEGSDCGWGERVCERGGCWRCRFSGSMRLWRGGRWSGCGLCGRGGMRGFMRRLCGGWRMRLGVGRI